MLLYNAGVADYYKQYFAEYESDPRITRFRILLDAVRQLLNHNNLEEATAIFNTVSERNIKLPRNLYGHFISFFIKKQDWEQADAWLTKCRTEIEKEPPVGTFEPALYRLWPELQANPSSTSPPWSNPLFVKYVRETAKATVFATQRQNQLRTLGVAGMDDEKVYYEECLKAFAGMMGAQGVVRTIGGGDEVKGIKMLMEGSWEEAVGVQTGSVKPEESIMKPDEPVKAEGPTETPSKAQQEGNSTNVEASSASDGSVLEPVASPVKKESIPFYVC
jgi:hypothetical protein